MHCTQVVYTNLSDECYELAMVALCLQHLTVTLLTTCYSRGNIWKYTRIPKVGPMSQVSSYRMGLKMYY